MIICRQVESAATAQLLTFKCLGHNKRGYLIESYQLEVTDSRDGTTVEISVEPRHLASARSMKRDPARSLYILVNQVVQT